MRIPSFVWVACYLALSAAPAVAWNGRDCPDPRSAQAITIFRDGLAERYPNFSYYGYDRYGSNGGTAPTATWAACFPNGVPACVERVLEEDGSYKPQPPISEYPQTISTEARNPPDELKAPSGPGYVLPPNIEQLAQQKGWKTIKMKSRGSGGFDFKTNVLQLVYIPGSSFTPPRNYDQYLQFPLPMDPNTANPVASSSPPTAADYQNEATGGPRLPSTMAMITMEKSTDGRPPRPYYQLWERPGNGNPAFQGGNPAGASSCYECHPNGLRAISPLGFFTQPGEPSLPPAMKQTVREIRTAMSSYGNPIDFRSGAGGGKFADPDRYGPPLGPDQPLTRNPSATSDADRYPTRTQSFIAGTSDKPGCAFNSRDIYVGDALGRPYLNYTIKMSANPSIRWDKVRDNMTCANCHNGDMRGALSPRVSRNAIGFKLLVDKSMPPGGGDLTQDERIALANCLNAEQAIEQKAWLRAIPCAPYTASPATTACPPGTVPADPAGAAGAVAGSLNGASPTPNCVPQPAIGDQTRPPVTPPPALPSPAPSTGGPAGAANNPTPH